MGSKLKFELERFLSENPIVACENVFAEESVQKGVSSMTADSCTGLSLEKLHSNRSLENGPVLINEFQQSSTGQFLTGESNRIGDRSLTSAVEKLSLGGEGTGQTWMNHPNLMNDQFESYMNKQSINSEPSTVANPSLRSSNRVSNGYYEISVPGLSPQLSFPARFVSDVQKKGEAGHLTPFETPNSAMPFTNEVPARNLQFPLSSHHDQMLLNGLSPVHFMHSQQMNHGEIGPNCAKGEQLHSCRMQWQQQYLHDLHNQQLERSNLFESCGNAAFGLRFQSPKQQRFVEVPFHPCREQSKHEGFCNGAAHCAASGIPNHAFASPYLDTLDAQEKCFKQSSPRKVPTRAHGLIGVDTEKLKYYFSQNGFLCPSCYVRQYGFPSTAKDCICHDNFRVPSMLSSNANRNTEIPPLKCNSLDEASGKIYLMAKDQHGCRFLQRMFSEGTKEDIEIIFGEIIHHVSELMVDPFGNYLIQKLLGVCDEDQRLQILYKINRPGELIRISCNMHGTRAVQKLIETLKTPEQFSLIVSLLKTGIVILMKNVNGNHVAQHCLQYLMPDYIGFLFEAATKSCVEVATDRHGCCVLQKCLAVSDARHRDRLLSEVVRNALVLSQDQYGNYVVQFALELARCPSMLPWVTSGIFKRLEGHFSDLSIQKYSSNVVERCVYAGDEYLAKVVDELINDERFSQIMLNPYGNYAVQAVLARSGICKSSVHAKLVAAIRPHVPLLRTNMYGKKVLAVLAKTN
ncbi:pumilio-like protein 12-like isoform X1 [Cucumis melo var. makuwa]|uniref:Pumilio-like protein 12-like isoform X1 n=1 Tax=Cucumis melo var. makuwa TaxID=1194695 RepID=A0A5A7UN64_CUCMM|nr:pumilio-like protein 12-like isoform X1 [Cucumis melo var. makuwa]TYK09976.1 pumilio-like protein 12-like isoform X1 [Cucumis melo var. makuwa]